MKKVRILEDLLSQVLAMYQQILANQNKDIVLTPDTIAALKFLSAQIEEISRMTEAEMAVRGINQEALKAIVLAPDDHLPADIKDLLQKSLHLKSQLEGCRNVLKEIKKKQNEEKKLNQRSNKRKDKFNKIGGKEGWIPL